MFNIAIIFVVDLFYTQESILSSVSSSHLTTALVAVVMSFVVLIGLRFGPKRKTFIVISWYSLALIGLFILGTYALFTSGLGLG
jgi:cation:H+ antiporter